MKTIGQYRFMSFVLCPLVALVLMAFAHTVSADPVERRRDQYEGDFSYFIYPIAGDIPGLGSAAGLGATVINMMDSELDFTGFNVTGDFEAAGYAFLDYHLIKNRLVFDVGYYDFKVAPTVYTRGLDSDVNDVILPKGEGSYAVGQLTITFDERRVETYYRLRFGDERVTEVLDKDGRAFNNIDDSEYNVKAHALGLTLDYTDDRLDPRKGIRLETVARLPVNENPYVSDFYVMDYNLTGYIPFRRWDSLGLNLFVSNAHVIHQASTDYAELQNAIGLNCLALPVAEQPQCFSTEDKFINGHIANNTHGTASALGGTQRLRSFANGRFYAGHALFWGAEYRWNLTDERTPFDIYMAKGIRTGVQLAFFAEQGSVADNTSDLFKDRRTSFGAGFRLVLSGVIIRADLASGDEGKEFVLFINYPWSVFSVDNPS
ncbi:MAG: hypothetical protein OEY67_01595 [Gammaproteobacteria bacterium]|nr:hypothetical protein [Gammaproteobacteria bacterium]